MRPLSRPVRCWSGSGIVLNTDCLPPSCTCVMIASGTGVCYGFSEISAKNASPLKGDFRMKQTPDEFCLHLKSRKLPALVEVPSINGGKAGRSALPGGDSSAEGG